MHPSDITPLLQTLGQNIPAPIRLVLIGGGALALLGSPRPTLDALRGMAGMQPERAGRLDAGFADDALKTNALQIFKTKGIVFRMV